MIQTSNSNKSEIDFLNCCFKITTILKIKLLFSILSSEELSEFKQTVKQVPSWIQTINELPCRPSTNCAGCAAVSFFRQFAAGGGGGMALSEEQGSPALSVAVCALESNSRRIALHVRRRTGVGRQLVVALSSSGCSSLLLRLVLTIISYLESPTPWSAFTFYLRLSRWCLRRYLG